MAIHDEILRKKINSRWTSFKDATKINQKKAAQALGMNQSAFSQYLRGEIPLNKDFIEKFEKLTQTDFSFHSETKVNSVVLPVKGTLSGKLYDDKRVVVTSFVVDPKSFLVEVDHPSHFFPRSSYLVCSPSEIRESDLVVMHQRNQGFVLGNVVKDDDAEWRVIEFNHFGSRSYPITRETVLYRVDCVHYPTRTGSVLKR
jgi:transcriptional regulator with XRE-family HTH domain